MFSLVRPFDGTTNLGKYDERNRIHACHLRHLCGLYFAANSETELLDQMQVFAEEVVPRIT